MPTYDYICKSCGHELEIFQSMSEGPKRKCPECGALKLQRQIGAGAGIIFKGTGYYQTDYRSQSYKDGAAKDKAPKESKTPSDSSSSSKTPSDSSGSSKKSAASKKNKAKD